MDNFIHSLGNRNGEIGVCELGMEENFGTQKSLITDLNVEVLFGDGICTCVLLDVLVRILVEFAELLGNIRTNVAVTVKKFVLCRFFSFFLPTLD